MQTESTTVAFTPDSVIEELKVLLAQRGISSPELQIKYHEITALQANPNNIGSYVVTYRWFTLKLLNWSCDLDALTVANNPTKAALDILQRFTAYMEAIK